MDTHLCSWNFLVDSKDKIAPAFTWKPIMNRLNTDMVYSSEPQIFDIQTTDIIFLYISQNKNLFQILG